MGPGGETLPNLSQLKPHMILESGSIGQINYQGAKIRKPLLAVSACNAKGNPVWFDSDESYILPANSEILSQIRKLISEVKGKIKLHQKNGTYVMKSWSKPSSSIPFQGHGR